MSRDNDVKQWLVRQHFYWEKGKPRGGATHIVTTADGKCAGKLAIVDDQHEAFLRHVASDFAHTCDQCSWTIHENATRYSRVYFKLNFDEVVPREGEPMETLFLQYVASVLQTCVIEHFPTVAAALRKRNNVANERGYCVVLAAPASFARFESNEAQNEAQWRRKISLHIIFPHLYADLNQMLQLRAAAIVMLDGRWDKYAPPSGASSWDVVIDANVYTTNDAGLCMPGRSTVCDACAAKSGRVARAYVPILALDTYGESAQLRHLLDSPFDMLRLCTIRMPYQFTNDLRFRVPNNLPTYSDAPIIYSVPDSYIQANLPPPGANDRAINPGTSQSLAARESRGHKRKAASLSFDPRTGLKRGAMSKSARKDMPTGRLLQQFVSPHYFAETFQKFLRECSKWPDYEFICVTEVRRFKSTGQRVAKASEHMTMEAVVSETHAIQNMTKIDDGIRSTFVITVTGQGSHYCHNVGGEHRDAKVYFFANYQGITQRCYCNEQTNSGVFCSQYVSPPVNWKGSARGLVIEDVFFGGTNMNRGVIGRSRYPLESGLQLPRVETVVQSMVDGKVQSDYDERKRHSARNAFIDKQAPDSMYSTDGAPSPEVIHRILCEHNRPGVYDPPLNSRHDSRRASQPVAEQPLALAIAIRKMREQQLRTASHSVDLPKRADRAPDLLCRLAPPDAGSVRSTQPSNALMSLPPPSPPPPPQSHSSSSSSQSHSSVDARALSTPRLRFISRTRGRILKNGPHQ